ncbi:hypothetical protein V8F20_010907 [Naviculisporaceae sp. PSN 640]
MEWTKDQYNKQYEKWVPWLEDLYLRYFTKDNKVSYTARENLDKTKVTGISQVDNLQDGVNNLVAGQVGQGGLGESVGNLASKEGVNRAERQGKDHNGSYIPETGGVPGTKPLADTGNTIIGGVAQGGKQVGGAVSQGLGGMLGGGAGGRK